jgi:hypothetical protein
MEPLSNNIAERERNVEVARDFLALQQNNLSIQPSRETTGRAFPILPEAVPQHPCIDQRSRAPRDNFDSDLSEPEQSASKISCQKRVRKMGGNAGGLWRQVGFLPKAPCVVDL